MIRILSGITLLLASGAIAYWLSSATTAPASVSAQTTQPADACIGQDREQPEQVWIEGGQFNMGSSDYYPEEGPVKSVQVEGFWIDRFEVSNARFARFVEATGYVTVAERQLDPADFPGIPADQLKPGSVVFVMPTDLRGGGRITDWWQFVPGANWRQPEGPGSSIEGREHFPVVHVAWEDARAYAEWAGRELPTEAQWEYAARGGLADQPYAWGETFRPGGAWQANTWQGMFPVSNSAADGHLYAAPTGCYPANGFDLYDMVGNVWEWVDQWYFPGHQAPNTERYPRGYDPRQPGVAVKVIKGGSYLCAKNYCMRYRPAARHAQETTLGAAHIGFRTVQNRSEG